jgi:hypothetical protein
MGKLEELSDFGFVKKLQILNIRKGVRAGNPRLNTSKKKNGIGEIGFG